MEELFIYYRQNKMFFRLPSDWELLTFAAFEDHSEYRDVESLTKRALISSIGSAPLKKRISPSDTVAILIEDLTRSSPKKLVLRALLEEMAELGIPKDHISIVISLGTHRALTLEELQVGYGEEIVKTYEFINHDCSSPDLVPVAKLKTGAIVKINRRVHESTFKIGIGSIFPHPMNGFGGGGKILFPGVANFEAILEHHLKYSFRDESGLGKLLGNPFYEEVCGVARAAGLNFIINSVLDHNDRLHDLVCGDPLEAHMAGIDLCKKIISMRFEKKSDVTIISAFPYTEGPQIMKPLAPASEITREDGVVILVADCTVPLSEAYIEGCERFRRKYAGNLREGVLGLFKNNRRIMEDGAPEFNMSIAQALLAQHDFKVILVSDDIPRETVERLGFLSAEDLNQAFAMSATFCPNPAVHIVPSGGVILPVVQHR